MATSDAPISIGAVTLLTKNRKKVADFYENVLGLQVLSDNGEALTLGQGEFPLLYLLENRSAKHRPTEAGLFHIAFLLPHRKDLGAWLRHAAALDVKLDGAADHLVSEALYLHDPEGNGLEIYTDRDRSVWPMEGSRIKIDSLALDLNNLAASSNRHWVSAPQGTVIGHVHLKVNNIEDADGFYLPNTGFEKMMAMPGASFYGSGGYHHHLAINTWNSTRAGKRSEDTTGIVEINLMASSGCSSEKSITDPWGLKLNVLSV